MKRYRIIEEIILDREEKPVKTIYHVQVYKLWFGWDGLGVYGDCGHYENLKDAQYRLDLLTGRKVDSQIRIIEER